MPCKWVKLFGFRVSFGGSNSICKCASDSDKAFPVFPVGDPLIGRNLSTTKYYHNARRVTSSKFDQIYIQDVLISLVDTHQQLKRNAKFCHEIIDGIQSNRHAFDIRCQRTPLTKDDYNLIKIQPTKQ